MFLFILKGEEGRERDRHELAASYTAPLGMEPKTLARAPTRNQTSASRCVGTALDQLSHTSRGENHTHWKAITSLYPRRFLSVK